jgi:hypothetical protein
MLIYWASPESSIAAGRATLMQGTNDNPTSKTRSLRPGHVRTVALAATIVGVVVLPIAAANANPLHSAKQTSVTGTPSTAPPATATALLPQYCGQTQTGLSGQVTEQTCVNDNAGVITGTAFVANSGAKPLTVAINLTRADGSSFASMTCTVAAHDASGECTTGPLAQSAGQGAFNAIAETVPVGAPLADGVLRADSGNVTPTAGTPAGAVPSTSTSASGSGATTTAPTTTATTAAGSTAS